MKIIFVFHLLLSTTFGANWPGDVCPVTPAQGLNETISALQPETEVVMSEGVVQQFNSRRGTGFIKPTSSNNLVFVHASDTKERIKPNQTVIYVVTKDAKGQRATQVEVKQP